MTSRRPEARAGPARRGRVARALFVALPLGACGEDPRASSSLHAAYARIVAEEDARGARGLNDVERHLTHPDPRVRALAARALGRLEDSVHLGRLEAALADPDARVRAAAAFASAQAVFRGDAAAAAPTLLEALAAETDPLARGALATHAGRLAVRTPRQRAALDSALVAAHRRLPSVEADPALDAPLGLARGVEAFARGAGDPTREALSPDLIAAARALARMGREPDAPSSPGSELRARRIRRLAVSALGRGGGLAPADAAYAIEDPDWGVRRLAVGAAARNGADAVAVAARGLADPDPRVRVDALRAVAAQARPAAGCAAGLDAFQDADAHVRSAAIALAGRPCPDGRRQRRALAAAARRLVADASAGLEARALESVDALASLARLVESDTGHARPVGADSASAWATAAAAHPSPFVRARAAGALGRLAALDDGAAAALRRLAEDPDVNAREAALRALGAPQPASVALYLDALDGGDPQLAMTAAALLVRGGAGAADARVVASRLLASLEGFTAIGKETHRDVRIALLDALDSIGGFSARDLAAYATDFDAEVAKRAAAMAAQAGEPRAARPAAMPRAPTPDAARLRELERTTVELRIAGLGDVAIALRPDWAATNADRFLRLAEAGRFDGLTFHRVEPNFVVQGGSPHANEYEGDGPYTRDEISAQAHWRGTVGLSTRGRDTGDGQIFVNLVDNVRLDFNYTIFGEVVSGMEVVDRMRVGAVIEGVRIRAR